ncbi:MAG: hypothetical protein SAK29_18560 [Scytonema sp. PMC 1069.18]|nr:hypothetical protein [Scytonema sp. PMC 1069.18]MEC4881673.1 hypothetical protein [Scytonema sp. PMC 1070.18]
MSVLRKYTVIVPLSLSISFLVTACSESKVSQCQRLIDVVNKGTELIENNKGQQVVTSLQLSKDLEATTKEIENLNLKDSRLQEFQHSFIKIFGSFSQSIAQAGKALSATKTAQASSQGRVQIQQAKGEIDKTLTAAANNGKEYDTLASQMNKYCNQPE